MRIVNTSDWSWDRLAPYGQAITAAMKRLVEMFPKDCTLESLADECFNRKKDLWLILDDDDEFLSFVMTEDNVVDATNHRKVMVTGMAGQQGVESVHLIADIEAWAKERGANETTVVGREGWKRPLAKQGYKVAAVLYRKSLDDGEA